MFNFEAFRPTLYICFIRAILCKQSVAKRTCSFDNFYSNSQILAPKDILDNRKKALDVLAKYGIYDNHVVLWGAGTSLREFLWSEDMVDACVHVLLDVDFSDVIGIEKYSWYIMVQVLMVR